MLCLISLLSLVPACLLTIEQASEAVIVDLIDPSYYNFGIAESGGDPNPFEPGGSCSKSHSRDARICRAGEASQDPMNV